MLFNSPAFIFVFLPLALLGFFACARIGPQLAIGWLTAASLVFYTFHDAAALPVLLVSITFNLLVARALVTPPPQPANAGRAGRAGRSGLLLGTAIAANLAWLFHFKYAAPFMAWAQGSAATAVPDLPLGISFFTFTQVAFLVDVYRRRTADLNPLRYALFVTYYPHLVAGPILHHAQTMPQFQRADIFRFSADRLADGTVLFILGLFKKVVLADQFATYADPAFNAAAAGLAPTLFEAWGAALGYTLQIYFDFSGYSDMAIGLAAMIGVQLMMNFNAPYKARSLIEFWRRWHITLSHFLRDYLYIPLGGNRHGPLRRHVNLLLTMLLGGLWHGAGWTFVAWGGVHGLCLVACHVWQAGQARAGLALPALLQRPAGMLAGGLTFTVVVLAWVLFRAADLPAANLMLHGMAGAHGALLPEQWFALAPWLATWADPAGKVPYLADGSVMGALEMVVMLALGLAIVWCAPTLRELSARWRYALVLPCAALALQRVLFGPPSPFLYFQF